MTQVLKLNNHNNTIDMITSCEKNGAVEAKALTDENSIISAIKNGTVKGQGNIEIASAFTMALAAARLVKLDKYTFMDKMHETIRLLQKQCPIQYDIDDTLNEIMGLAFISATPEDMSFFVLSKAKTIAEKNNTVTDADNNTKNT